MKNSSLVDTRDQLTYKKGIAHIYILHTYGIPDGNIWNYYRRFILDRISEDQI